MGTPASVSVVIPTRNAGPAFAETLQAIRAQRLDRPVELLVIDSGSSDGTPALARRFGAGVLSIAPAAFGHGRTRNQAIAACGGAYVALTVQDAIPADENWLAALARVLDANPQVAGVTSRTIPHEGVGWIAHVASGYGHAQRVQQPFRRLEDPAAFARLSFAEKQNLCAFDNVSGMLRRQVWERHPFSDVPYAEDLAWGRDVLLAGHALAYEPASVVRHSHERSDAYDLRRAYINSRIVGELLGESCRPLGQTEAQELWRLVAEVRRLSQLYRLIPLDLAFRLETRWLQPWYRAGLDEGALAKMGVPITGAEAGTFTRYERDSLFRRMWWGPEGDRLRQTILEGDAPDARLEILRYVVGWRNRAQQESALTRDLYRHIWLHAMTQTVGRRFGEATRYDAGGAVGARIHRRLAGGV
ncbi:MAG: glycosyltransferase family 2 protein [Anaerolineae bacterium]